MNYARLVVLGALVLGNAVTARQAAAQQTVVSSGSLLFTEPYAFTFESPTAYEMIVTTGDSGAVYGHTQTNGTEYYGCTRDGSTWRTFNIGYTGDWSDTSGMSVWIGGVNYAIITSLQAGSNGARWYWSTEPCPASGSPVWYWWNYPTDTTGTVDYVHSAYDTHYQQMGITYSQIINTYQRMVVGRITSNFEGLYWYWSGCSNIANHNVNLINSVFDSNGDQHLIYADFTSHNIQHEIYRRSGGFACDNHPIGSFSIPTNTCPQNGCNMGTYYEIGGGCLTANPSPTIAYDGFGAFVASYSTPGSNGCSTKSETRAYTGNGVPGNSWKFDMVTGCNTSIYTRATWHYATNDASIVTMYEPPGSGKLAQANFYTSNGGQSWTGVYTSSAQSYSPIYQCYWGDYQGAAEYSTGLFNAYPASNYDILGLSGLTE
jgi:hypothetical protein